MRTLWVFSLIFCVQSLALELEKEVTQGVQAMLPELEHHKLFYDINPMCNFPDFCGDNITSVTVANITVFDTPAQELEHHYLWSVIDNPAIQLALTRPGDVANIDWAAITGHGELDSAISYGSVPAYSAAIMLSQIIEFNDVNDLGYLDPAYTEVIGYPMKGFDWSRRILENSTERFAFEFIGVNYTAFNSTPDFNITEGKLNLTFSSYATEGFGRWLPHLSNSESINQMDVQLDHIKTNSGFAKSRFALEFVIVSNAQVTNEPIRESTKTLDDEHTPGIFQTQELVIPGYNKSLQSYLQWRPVVYTTMNRDLTSSTNVNVSEAQTVAQPNVVFNNSILYAFYGEDLEDMLVKKINVSMGAKGDGYYRKTNFTAWTFTFGSGEPIHNGMSPLIILLMTVMFGLLLLILLTTAVMCIIKRIYRRRSGVGYNQMANEETTETSVPDHNPLA